MTYPWKALASSVCGFALGCLACALITLATRHAPAKDKDTATPAADTVTVTRTDTVRLPAPEPYAVRVTDTMRIPVVIADTARETPADAPKDTVWYNLPRTQKEYRDSLYTAFVSGYEPRLDSIAVYTRTNTVTVTVTKTQERRWSVGIVGGVGYGITARKPDAFVGIGAAYRVW